MKQSPQDKKLDEVLHASILVAGGFMGSDRRTAQEVIEADRATLESLGIRAAPLAQRMREVTRVAESGLGTWVDWAGGLRVMVEDYKGDLVCPWPHGGHYHKRVTTLECPHTHNKLMWTDLNVHLIEAHGFFEGRGSAFRVEPLEAVRFLFGREERFSS
jgi:hypothetical protein